MKCSDIDRLLADYLGNELNAERRAQFDGHLASCARCSAEVEALAKVQTELADSPEVSASDAEWQTRLLEVRPKMSWPSRWASAGLRYAAMLVLGVGLGWQLKQAAEQPAPGSGSLAPIPIQNVASKEVHPAWIEAAIAANRAHGGRSSFVRSLAALSSAGHKL